jgi:hypothetical protein
MKIENDQYKPKDMGPLFDICERKHGGNPMSVKANKVAHKYKIPSKQVILEQLREDVIGSEVGLTCEELERFTGLSHQTCSARCADLKREGKIKIVGERKTRSGSPASVYQIS